MTSICRSRRCTFNAYRAFQVWFHFQIAMNLRFVKRLDKLAKEIPANGTNLYIGNVLVKTFGDHFANRAQEGVCLGGDIRWLKRLGIDCSQINLFFPSFQFSLISDLCSTDTKPQRASILILKSATKRPFLRLDK